MDLCEKIVQRAEKEIGKKLKENIMQLIQKLEFNFLPMELLI